MNPVKTLIDKSGKSCSQIAREMGVSIQRMHDWKSGIRPMPEDQFAKLAELVEGENKAKKLLWDFVKAKSAEKFSRSFNWLLSLAKPHGALISVA